MPLARTDSRWIRAVLYGLLAEISTAVVVILVTTVHSVVAGGAMIDTSSRFAHIWGAAIGIVGGAFFVYAYARRLGSSLSARFIAHGLVVAIAAAALHLISTLGSGDKLDALHYAAAGLKLIAGAVGGRVASRYV